MSIVFGDFDDDDAFDHEPPAPEQVAYRLHKLRSDVEDLIGRPLRQWDELNEPEQAAVLALGAAIVEWLATHADPDQPEPLAHAIHDLRQALNPTLPDWDDLDEDERAIGEALMHLVIDWLRREGAIG